MLRDRFTDAPDAAFDDLNRSLPVDQALWREDLDGSRAHVRMLAAQGVLTAAEGDTLLGGLDRVAADIAADGIPATSAAEDIHCYVEQRLADLVGPVAGKLHTGRSRNDQVATDQRLALRRLGTACVTGVTAVLRALAAQARTGVDVVVPFYTHLQRAQPVLLAHHWLAHAAAFQRDLGRFRDCLARADVCPLGAGAGAGTTFPIDPAHTAQALGFATPLQNSLDAVAARDHIAEFAAAAALCAVHCSRLGEELVLWTSTEFGFARMADAFASSSSIMPQKRNADAAELARAVAGRVIGRFTGFAATCKGLPLAYNKDLQEATAVLLEVGDAMRRLLPAVAGMVAGLQVDPARMRAAVDDPRGFILATDLADHLVRRGLPFREAHGQVAALVRWCEQQPCGLSDCTLEQIRAHCPAAADDVQQLLTVEAALAARAHIGGTAPDRVRESLEALERALA